MTSREIDFLVLKSVKQDQILLSIYRKGKVYDDLSLGTIKTYEVKSLSRIKRVTKLLDMCDYVETKFEFGILRVFFTPSRNNYL